MLFSYFFLLSPPEPLHYVDDTYGGLHISTQTTLNNILEYTYATFNVNRSVSSLSVARLQVEKIRGEKKNVTRFRDFFLFYQYNFLVGSGVALDYIDS